MVGADGDEPVGRDNGAAGAAEPGNVVAHHDHDHNADHDRDDAARHECSVDLGPDDGQALIANAQRRHGTLGGVVAAGMFGLDQALGRRVKQETQVVVAAPTEPVDIDADGIAIAVDDTTSIVVPAQQRSTLKIPARRRSRR